jgi:hypothetical protein
MKRRLSRTSWLEILIHPTPNISITLRFPEITRMLLGWSLVAMGIFLEVKHRYTNIKFLEALDIKVNKRNRL